MQTESVLSLQGYGVAFGEKVVLNGIDLDVRASGIIVLMGPTGTGKSTLLRSLAGINSAAPSFRSWGRAYYAGYSLDEGGELPALVAQHTRLMMASVLENVIHDLPERKNLTTSQQAELARRLLRNAGLDELVGAMDTAVLDLPLSVQRHLAIARTAAANPRLLCVDEPTADLSDEEAARILEYLGREAERRAVLVVLHNQQQTRALGGEIAFLAGGWIQECRSTSEFLTAPQARAARDFVRTGSCDVPSPNARPEELDESVRIEAPPVPAEARTFVSDTFGPRGFLWLKKGLLAGTPRPGVFFDIDYDLRALQRVGINVLVSLTKTPVAPEVLAPYGITGIWLPVEDMGTPEVGEADALCAQVAALLEDGQAVAYHCRAGLGRTGTLLAAQLIWEGSTALDALESVRRIEPRWVQSQVQVQFLERFAEAKTQQRPGRLAL